MAIHSLTVKQICSYRPVADELEERLETIQSSWGYKVTAVYETNVNNNSECSKQGFIILYDDLADNKNEVE